jgi:hypothetical protein
VSDDRVHDAGTKGSEARGGSGASRVALFPYTIAFYLCATLWLQRTGGARFYDIGVDLLGSIVAMGLVSTAAWWVAARFTADPARRALVALVAGIWSVLYGSYLVFATIAFDAEWVVLLIWTALAFTISVIIVRSRIELGAVRRALDVAGFVMLAFTVPPLLRAMPHEPEPTAWTERRVAGQPDIYIIVPDKFSSSGWLAREYGLDHTPFEDSLRALGFVVPREPRANYAHTKLAVPTFMEGQYVAFPGDSGGRAEYDAYALRVQRSPLWAELQGHGYRVVFFPTTFSATRTAEGPDLMMNAPQPSTTRFAETWYVNSPVATLSRFRCQVVQCVRSLATPFPVEPLSVLEWKADLLTTLPDSAGPVAAFVHLISPHEPYLFADDCSARDPWWPLADDESEAADTLRAAYAAQVRCLDRILLRTVRTIIARSATPPVIIIQSDHGRGRITTDVIRGFTYELDQLSEAQLGERFAIFAAYRFPGADSLVYDGMTPVNVMPMLRHALWGAPLVRNPDRSFWSPYQRALELTELEPSRLRMIQERR